MWIPLTNVFALNSAHSKWDPRLKHRSSLLWNEFMNRKKVEMKGKLKKNDSNSLATTKGIDFISWTYISLKSSDTDVTEHKLEINTSWKYVRIGSISVYDYQNVLIATPQHENYMQHTTLHKPKTYKSIAPQKSRSKSACRTFKHLCHINIADIHMCFVYGMRSLTNRSTHQGKWKPSSVFTRLALKRMHIAVCFYSYFV